MDDQWESQVIEFGAINITGFRIVDHSRKYVREFMERWNHLDPQKTIGAGKNSISVWCLIGDSIIVIRAVCFRDTYLFEIWVCKLRTDLLHFPSHARQKVCTPQMRGFTILFSYILSSFLLVAVTRPTNAIIFISKKPLWPAVHASDAWINTYV